MSEDNEKKKNVDELTGEDVGGISPPNKNVKKAPEDSADDSEKTESESEALSEEDSPDKDDEKEDKAGESPENEDSEDKKQELSPEEAARIALVKQQFDQSFFQLAAKIGSRKRGILGCLTVLFAICVLVVALFILFSIKFVQNDLLSKKPLSSPAPILSAEGKAELDQKLKEYEAAVEKTNDKEDPPESYDHKMVLTGPQLNHLLSKIEVSKKPEGLRFIRLLPDGDKARIMFTLPLGGKKFFNVTMKGNPRIDDFVFKINMDRLQIGRLKRAKRFEERAVSRVNRLLETEPTRLKLPFLIKEMRVEDSKIYLTLRFRRQ